MGNYVDNDIITNNYNMITFNYKNKISKYNKLKNIYKLSDEGIDYVYLFPDSNISLELISIIGYMSNSNVDEIKKYDFFIQKFKLYYNTLDNEDCILSNSTLYHSIISIESNKICFFFKEFKDYITSYFKNNYIDIIKENNNLTISEFVNKLYEDAKNEKN